MKSRDYGEIVRRIKNIHYSYLKINEIGSTEHGNILSAILKSKSDSPIKILISAGMHGDEPAGVEAVLKFLENDNSNLLDIFEFTVIPCINPYGFINDVRWNAEGVDINRTFENNLSKEALIIKNFLKDRKFDLFVDLHEDWEYKGFYLFEITKSNNKIGREIVDSIGNSAEINNNEVIDGFLSDNGVITLNCEEFCTSVFALYLAENNSSHCLTLETPTQWTFDSRVNAHLYSLSIALNGYMTEKIES